MAVNSDPIMTWSFIRKCEPSDAILDILIPGEHVLQCYATVRDKAALTDKRIIFTDVQGITGKKRGLFHPLSLHRHVVIGEYRAF